MTQPGLSVWMWGPIMWNIFHTIAYQCDTLGTKAYKVDDVFNFFVHIQQLLPCRYCRDSYNGTEKDEKENGVGGFLLQVEKERGETIRQAFQDRHLVSFVYDLHNKVNSKLAKQRWEEVLRILKSEFHKSAGVLDALSSSSLEDKIVNVLDKRPTIMTLYKRNEFFLREPINLEGTIILSIQLLQRVQSTHYIWNYVHFMNNLCTMLSNIDDNQCQLLALHLRKPRELLKKEANKEIAEGITLQAMKDAFYDFTKPPSGITKDQFFKNLQIRLDLMVASACGAGTCK